MRENACPICKSKKYEATSFSDEIWGGIYEVENHSYCPSCGFRIEMAYCQPLIGFEDHKRGWRDYKNKYHQKDIRKHKRYRRKNKERCEGIEVNPEWVYFI